MTVRQALVLPTAPEHSNLFFDKNYCFLYYLKFIMSCPLERAIIDHRKQQLSAPKGQLRCLDCKRVVQDHSDQGESPFTTVVFTGPPCANPGPLPASESMVGRDIQEFPPFDDSRLEI